MYCTGRIIFEGKHGTSESMVISKDRSDIFKRAFHTPYGGKQDRSDPNTELLAITLLAVVTD
ncbi:hypothetical protein QG37_03978 [Candidozyma auris]|uniref:Uncharacterized protein n=1 Tax=Candidozyma auris TaxID=498019 RepID=A0A0L0NYB7_CANAR|nr:hypothetical protein QG37_03978 [[Candida] auris]